MSRPELLIDHASAPGERIQALGRSIFNLFPAWNVRVHGCIDSTSSEARRLTLTLGGDAWPRVILAEEQTAGRGRQGKQWVAPRETSLLVTIMAPVQQFPKPSTLAPLAVGCWVIEGLERVGVENARLKWPNDILVNGGKVGGILCETSGAAMLAGIGINLTQREDQLPPREAGVPPATSLRKELGLRAPDYLPAALTVLGGILESIEHQPTPEWILKRYRQLCDTLGRVVDFDDHRDGRARGLAHDIDPTGALVVEVDGRGPRTVTTPVEHALT